MDLPDPDELFRYHQRLHDAGFGDETARAILAAVVTGAAPTGVALAPAPGPIADSGEAKLDPGAQPRCAFTSSMSNAHVRCGRSFSSEATVAFVRVGSSATDLTQGEATVLRDVLTALLEEDS